VQPPLVVEDLDVREERGLGGHVIGEGVAEFGLQGRDLTPEN
jgi:hypothetical protein